MTVWLVQNLILAVLQAGLTGLLVLRWLRGTGAAPATSPS